MSESTSTMQILMQFKDEASQAIKSFGSNLHNTMVDAADASRKFGLALAGIGASAVAGGAYVIGQAREAVAAENQLGAVLKSTGGIAGVTADMAKNLANEMQRVTNFDDEAVLGGENLLLTFTKIGKDIFPQATETILDMSTALGQDVKNSAIQLGKALQDPIEGVTALRRVGVNFNDEQQDVIKNLVQTGKTAEAQKFILRELQTEFGGSARALASPITQMKNQLNDSAETIGKQLLPYVNQLASAIKGFAENTLPGWIEKAKEIVHWLKEHPAVLYIVAGAVMGALVPAIYAAVVAFASLTVTLAPWLIGGALIAGIVAGIVWIVKHWDLVMAKVKEVWDAIVKFITDNWQAIVQLLFPGLGTLVVFFVDNWGKIKQFVIDVWNAIKNTISTIFTSVRDFIGGTLNNIWNSWQNVWNKIKTFFLNIWDGMVQGFKTSINFIIGGINAFIRAFNSMKIDVPKVSIPHVGDFGGFSIGLPTLPEIPLLAKGGIVTQPTLAMIGEAGPEAVIPLGRSAAGYGGLTVILQGTFLTGPEAAREYGDILAREIKRHIKI